MKTFKQFRPTQFDDAGVGSEGQEDWLVLPTSRTRDTGPLEETNFAAALERLGGESDTVQVHRFGHWGPGWFEIIVVHPSRKEEAEEIEKALENYPVLDDEELYRREQDASDEDWESWGESEFKGVVKGLVELDEEQEDVLDSYVDLAALWREASDHLGWSEQNDGQSTIFNFKGAEEYLSENTDLIWDAIDKAYASKEYLDAQRKVEDEKLDRWHKATRGYNPRPPLTYPHWIINGRIFLDGDDARDFAQDLANSSGEAVTVMQKDDNYLSAWVLERRVPSETGGYAVRGYNPGTPIARWESRGGKYFAELYDNGDGTYSYHSNRAGGYMGVMTRDQAIAEMEKKVKYLAPDALKLGLMRTMNPPITIRDLGKMDYGEQCRCDIEWMNDLDAVEALAREALKAKGPVGRQGACLALCTMAGRAMSELQLTVEERLRLDAIIDRIEAAAYGWDTAPTSSGSEGQDWFSESGENPPAYQIRPMSETNLDDMEESELWRLYQALNTHQRRKARRLFPDEPEGFVTATRILKNYAAIKATAIAFRKRGEINTALRYEQIADRIYNNLPDYAKW